MICAIVLAAGRSERMGTQKLLLALKDKPIIAKVVDELSRTALGQITVVVGRDGDRIEAALAGRAVTFVRNPEISGDMLSSIRCGLRALPPECEAVMVVLGDQPGINGELVTELVETYRKSSRGIVLLMHQNKRGHPVIFAAKYREEMLTCYEDVGLHGLLDAHPDEVVSVSVSVSKTLEDLDTPEDYDRYLRSNA